MSNGSRFEALAVPVITPVAWLSWMRETALFCLHEHSGLVPAAGNARCRRERRGDGQGARGCVASAGGCQPHLGTCDSHLWRRSLSGAEHDPDWPRPAVAVVVAVGRMARERDLGRFLSAGA